jgi:hypothetical protein
VQWNGSNLGEGLKVPVLGADTAAVRAELEQQESQESSAKEFSAINKVARRPA